MDNNNNNDDENSDDDYERTRKISFSLFYFKLTKIYLFLDVRRKAVGLGDNPYK